MADIISYISSSSIIVQCVFVVLFLTSIISWALIIERFILFRKAKQELVLFEEKFSNSSDLPGLYSSISLTESSTNTLEKIFIVGCDTFNKACASNNDMNYALPLTKRAMQIIETKATQKLQDPLVWLATIGSTSPYVGLFGTVWGIIHAFSAINSSEQATLAVVAPGISEALVATALGLFVAIPAVIFYNRMTSQLDYLSDRYDIFQEELLQVIALRVKP